MRWTCCLAILGLYAGFIVGLWLQRLESDAGTSGREPWQVLVEQIFPPPPRYIPWYEEPEGSALWAFKVQVANDRFRARRVAVGRSRKDTWGPVQRLVVVDRSAARWRARCWQGKARGFRRRRCR